jgi:hypothetical protein
MSGATTAIVGPPPPPERTVKLGTMLAVATAFIGGMSFLAAIHAQLVVPAIMREVALEIDREMKDPSNHPIRPNDYTEDRALMYHELEAMEARLNARFDRLESSLRK